MAEIAAIPSFSKGAGMQEKGEEKKSSKFEETPVADFFMGIFLIVLSLVVFYAAWNWPRFGNFAHAPGLFPLMISSSLLLMAVFLLMHGIRMKGHTNLAARLRQSMAGEDTRPTLLTLLLVFLYMVVLVNLVPFEVSTFIYVAASLYLFWQRKLWLVFLLAAGAAISYSVIFQYFFKILLPGPGN